MIPGEERIIGKVNQKFVYTLLVFFLSKKNNNNSSIFYHQHEYVLDFKSFYSTSKDELYYIVRHINFTSQLKIGVSIVNVIEDVRLYLKLYFVEELRTYLWKC